LESKLENVMATATISIDVDPETAEAYAAASEQDRLKLKILLRLGLRHLSDRPARSLTQVMDDIGAQAAANGMTPEILDSILRDE
jgi:hypothetical protein